MSRNNLRIGKMAYANLFPLFYMLQEKCDCSRYEFIEGVPSDLNKKIRIGEIDISPSSSIEYLRNSAIYSFIEDHSISSKGPVRSIFLFSKKPIQALAGATVLTTSQSETSVALLEIIFRKFYGINCRFEQSSEPFEKGIESHEAYMLIGDTAMLESARWKGYQYDLGELWYRKTGLPMTYALWIVRKECVGGELLRRFTKDLDYAKKEALGNLNAVAAASPIRQYFSREELVNYWKGISYDFGEEHQRGLALFQKYAEDLGII